MARKRRYVVLENSTLVHDRDSAEHLANNCHELIVNSRIVSSFDTLWHAINSGNRQICNKCATMTAEDDSHSNEEEFIGLAVFGEKIKLISLTKDGTYLFLDESHKLHNILYVAVSDAIALREAVTELEDLLNSPTATEPELQEFFQRHPKFILNDEYCRAHPHVTLIREEGPLIPDFMLEPIKQNSLCDILDLKLPTARVFVMKKNRMRYSAAVMEACAQLREYGDYFDDEENRRYILQKHGLLAYKPKMIIVIGRRGSVSPIVAKKISSDLPRIELRTYDDVLDRVKARLEC